VAGSIQEGAQQVREAPEMVQRQTQGNPLAAGLVAFGAGMLLATLFPPTGAEQRAASAVQERVEPLKEQALEAGREMKDDLQGTARESAQQIKETATEATQGVKQQAQSSAEKVKEHRD
jgi:soluble cytochrome b562